MIYFPRSYARNSKLFKKVEMLNYRSGEASQTSFIYPIVHSDPPEVVWWMFGGNGSAALEWVSMLERAKLPESHVFVLVDYPGYGRCGGKPCPETIYDSVGVLHGKLADKWKLKPLQLSARSKAIGHSLGSAIAFHTAGRFEMDEVIAVSPFTSMHDMAKRRVGCLNFLLRHHYDNRESVTKLTNQTKPAEIHIFHGTSDSLIPVSMGKELSMLTRLENVKFNPVKGRGHNDILFHIEDAIFDLIND